ncbi:MAG: D-alanyl-D-alanine carboxypeptidase [Alphaproteobacteria bacterium]|nr:D-alanyl-D-alanine carboxypeptidase [Alphaproteobacteria bacterium]
MKHLFFLLMLAITLVTGFSPVAEAKYASIVVNESTGEVMYSRNADKQLYPASLTKIMTLYMVFEALDQGKVHMDTKMRVSNLAASRSPSKLGLRPGSHITVKNAIYALITKSANDVATVISEHLASSEREFAKKMTRKAQAIGMSQTTFRNASGLPHSKQKSTARDMAKLAVAIRNDFPHYFQLFKTKSFEYNGRRYKNHNTLLSSYEGTDGIKTGYIRASGFNLVATVERRGVRLVGVVFGGRTGRSRDQHMVHLLNKQFARIPQYAETTLVPKKKPLAPTPVAPPPPKPNILTVSRDTDSGSLSVAVSVPPARPELADPEPVEEPRIIGWGIQVGSFEKRASAHRAARNARVAANDILSHQPAQLRQIKYGNLTLWQVHFSGFDETLARQACLQLFQKGMSCVAIPQISQSS